MTREMIKARSSTALAALMQLGFLIIISDAWAISRGNVDAIFPGLILLAFATTYVIWQAGSYAAGKGYHRAWGLLGLLSFIGLITA